MISTKVSPTASQSIWNASTQPKICPRTIHSPAENIVKGARKKKQMHFVTLEFASS